MSTAGTRPGPNRGHVQARSDDLAGRALDERYELLELVGEGTFGRVYRGFDRRLARAVAVKVIKPWWAQDSAWVERFEREAQLLARVNDPGIVQIFDFGHAAEGPYYVAELVDGESLSERLSSGPLGAEQAAAIAQQLCRALGSAHRQGIVHCDVKPANVMLAPDGTAKVGDFGVARLAEGNSISMAATIVGTPRYMSPEQARGLATTPATDVYSAGVVLYEMLAGRAPFQSGSAVELGIRHLQDEPPPLSPRVPLALREVVTRALAKEPADRYEDGAAMAAALRSAAAGERSAGAALEPPAVRPRMPRRAKESAVAADDGDAGSPTAMLARETPAGSDGDEGGSSTVKLAGAGGPRGPSQRTLLLGSGSPPARRRDHRGGYGRRLTVLGSVAVMVLAGAVLLILRGVGGASTTVPELRGLPAGGVSARTRRTHLHATFVTQHSATPAGLAIAQSPAPGARVGEGSTVRVIFSSGPPPVAVPGVVGQPASSAESLLAGGGLRYAVEMVGAPGSTTGEVLHQTPAAGTTVASGATVALSVAEAPRWRPLTTFSGIDNGESVPFRILGSTWRVSYSMSYRGTCLLIITCFGPSAEATNIGTGSAVGGFDLSEGTSHSHTFATGPGLFRLDVAGGEDSARWSMTVEDHY